MGIGRREFLRLTSLALTGLTLDPHKSIAINRNYYVNKKHGIILKKPDGWDFIAVRDYGRLADEQILPKNEAFTKEEILDIVGEPAFVITKYYQDTPEFKGKFSPTISAFIHHKSEIDFGYDSFENIIRLSGIGTGEILKDYIETAVEGPFSISNCKTYIRRATYSFEHVDLIGSIKTNLTVVMIEHNDFFYFINMHDSDQVNENASTEFESCTKKIRLI